MGAVTGDATASATRITPGNALRPEDIAAQVAAGSVVVPEDVASYALRLGDDALILAQRLGWWVSRAPELEEDIALSNIALDLLGHARSFLTYAGGAWGKTEDDLAYFRGEAEFRSAHLVEQPNGDFARTIARQLVVSTFQHLLYSQLIDSADATLAAISAKALKEVSYHQDHAYQWVLRLGLGTQESRRRMVNGLELTWPYVAELFDDDELIDRLEGIAVRPSSCCEWSMTAGSRRYWLRPRLTCKTFPEQRAVADRDGTPSTWVTSSPRCRSWPGNIPAPRGDCSTSY
jgi:phenylacetate-CoA oxygenase, PaaI subunit